VAAHGHASGTADVGDGGVGSDALTAEETSELALRSVFLGVDEEFAKFALAEGSSAVPIDDSE